MGLRLKAAGDWLSVRSKLISAHPFDEYEAGSMFWQNNGGGPWGGGGGSNGGGGGGPWGGGGNSGGGGGGGGRAPAAADVGQRPRTSMKFSARARTA